MKELTVTGHELSAF